MYEYIDSELGEERTKYDEFRRATGFGYETLYQKHKDAVKLIDESQEYTTQYMAVSPKLFAYLTDLALHHLALGYESQRPKYL